MSELGKIGVVVGSTRPRRICQQLAQWVLAIAAQESRLSYELIDLAEIALPFLDEPRMASLGHYEHAHTKRWSALVQSYDGFVFVFPQYNWGYTAVLKNALDFLYAEWHGKAAATVTYGTRGGGRGAEQLGVVLQGGLDMRLTATNPKLNTPPDCAGTDALIMDLASLERFAPDVRAMNAELEALVGAGIPAGN
jgi:NAD(P)H-dependent FMN reductase